MNMRTN